MSNYVQSTNFATKDALASGDPLKIVKGTEINTEFNNIAIAVATKADLASPTFTGTVTAPAFVGPLTGNATTATTATTATAAGNVTGVVAVANGGTGVASLTANNVILGNGTGALQVVAPSTNGNVLTSNGTTWTSATPAAAPVTSVNSQTGAVVTTTLGNIGSVLIAANTSTSTYYLPGSTAAGSSLVYTSTFVSATGVTGVVSNGTFGGSDYTYNSINSSTIRVTTSNVGYQSPLGMTALSGTWRALAYIGAASVTWDGSNNTSYSPMGLWVRIS